MGYLEYQEKKKREKVKQYLLQQVNKDPNKDPIIFAQYAIEVPTIWLRSARLLNHEQYHILTAELYHPVKSFNEKFYICETCHKHLNKDGFPIQAVCNKKPPDPIPNDLSI